MDIWLCSPVTLTGRGTPASIGSQRARRSPTRLTGISSDDGSVNVLCGAGAGGGTHFILDLMAIIVLEDLAIGPAALGAAAANAAETVATRSFGMR